MSVSATIHRDSLICAACSSVTAAKELFLFNANQTTDEEKAARGGSHLTVTGDVVMPTASTSTVLIMMYLFF